MIKQQILTAAYLTLPLVISGVLHMLIVKKGLLCSLTIPINEKLFGANKTWRGFVVMPLATVAGAFMVQYFEGAFGDSLLLRFSQTGTLVPGILLGLAYVTFELPNSFFKRRLGVRPGTNPDKHRLWFIILDQTDSALGCALVYHYCLQVDWVTSLLILPVGGFIHLLVNMCLFAVGLKKQRF